MARGLAMTRLGTTRTAQSRLASGSRLRRTGGALVAAGALLVGYAPLVAAIPGEAADVTTITGQLTIVDDGPFGAEASVATSNGRVVVTGLTEQAAELGLGTGDTVSLAVDPLPQQPAAPDQPSPPDAAAVPGSLAVLAAAPAVTPLADAVPHTITLVRAVWPGPALSESPSFDLLEQAAGEAVQYWNDASGGAVHYTLAPERYDGISLAKSPCLDLAAAYDEVKLRLNWQEGPGKHLVIASRQCDEGFGATIAGWGSLGATRDAGGFVFLNGVESMPAGTDGNVGDTLIHELGHNMSLGHSNQAICYAEPINPPDKFKTQLINDAPKMCRASEYGGVYSTMGHWLPGAPAALGGHLSFLLDFTSPDTLRDVVAPGQQEGAPPSQPQVERVRLIPAAGSGDGLKYARISDTKGNSYYLEFRTPTGQDAHQLDPNLTKHLPSGVLVTKVFGDTPGTEFGLGDTLTGQKMTVEPNSIYLLDAQPWSNPYSPDQSPAHPQQEWAIFGGLFEGNPVLMPGTPVSLGDVSVNLVSQSAGEAVVDVIFPPTRPVATVASKPLAVTATKVGTNSALVSWRPPATNGGAFITNYQVSTPNGPFTCSSVTEFSCRIDGLLDGNSYRFAVTATNGLGPSGSSDPSAPLAIGAVPTPTPTGQLTPTPTPTPTVTPKPTLSTTPKPTASTTSTPKPSATTSAATPVSTTSAQPVVAASATVDPFASTDNGETYTGGSTVDPFASTYTGTTTDPFATTSTDYTSTYVDPYASSYTTTDPYAASTSGTDYTSSGYTATTSGTTSLATTGSEGLPRLLIAGVMSIVAGAGLLLLGRPRRRQQS